MADVSSVSPSPGTPRRVHRSRDPRVEADGVSAGDVGGAGARVSPVRAEPGVRGPGDASPRSPVAKRSRHGPRGSRYCVTFFGSGGRAGGPRFDPAREPGLHRASSGAEEEEDEKRAADSASSFADREGEKESEAEFGALGRDEDAVQRGDGCVGSRVSGVPPEAQRLSDELRGVLLKDKQVRKPEGWPLLCSCPFELTFSPVFCPLHSFP